MRARWVLLVLAVAMTTLGCSSDTVGVPAAGGAGGGGGAAGAAAGAGGHAGGAGAGGAAGAAGGAAGTGGHAGAGGQAGAAGTGGHAGAGGQAGAAGAGGMGGLAGAGGTAGAAGAGGLRVLLIGIDQTPLYDGIEFGTMLTTLTGVPPVRIHDTPAAPTLTAADLDNHDVAIVEQLQRDYSPSEAALMASWVNAGHGLVLLNGFTADPSRSGTFAASYAVSYDPTLLQTGMVGYVTSFAFPALTSGVSSLGFYGGYAMTTTNPDATVFASLSASAVGIALPYGSGRVAFWSDDWIVAEWELRRMENGGYPAVTFWTNVLKWVGQR
jgi:hypothetical protein